MEHAKRRELPHWFAVIEKPLLAIRTGPILVSVYLAANGAERNSVSYYLSINQIVTDQAGNFSQQTVVNAQELDRLFEALSLAKNWLSQEQTDPRSFEQRLKATLTTTAGGETGKSSLTQPN